MTLIPQYLHNVYELTKNLFSLRFDGSQADRIAFTDICCALNSPVINFLPSDNGKSKEALTIAKAWVRNEVDNNTAQQFGDSIMDEIEDQAKTLADATLGPYDLLGTALKLTGNIMAIFTLSSAVPSQKQE